MRGRPIDLGGGRTVHLAPAHEVLLDLVDRGSRVLDLGCGEGDLLLALSVLRGVKGEGIEISGEAIRACVAKGLVNVHHGDLDEGLMGYADGSVDYALLTDTIQVLARPMRLIRDMARVARKCVVTFPNFAHWRARLELGFRGRMPRTPALPFEWYESPNIHLTTIHDFRDACRTEGFEILDEAPLAVGRDGRPRRIHAWPNLRAESGLFVLAGGAAQKKDEKEEEATR